LPKILTEIYKNFLTKSQLKKLKKIKILNLYKTIKRISPNNSSKTNIMKVINKKATYQKTKQKQKEDP
jgi:hypothetical protein